MDDLVRIWQQLRQRGRVARGKIHTLAMAGSRGAVAPMRSQTVKPAVILRWLWSVPRPQFTGSCHKMCGTTPKASTKQFRSPRVGYLKDR
eukprot:scaffold60011_cov15-Tisochrysis_lutea.AAC.1